MLCVDEKPQIQALDRSAPVLPLMPVEPARQTHDYIRNGTTNLYAALAVASGQVISEVAPRRQDVSDLLNGQVTLAWGILPPSPAHPSYYSPWGCASRKPWSLNRHKPKAPDEARDAPTVLGHRLDKSTRGAAPDRPCTARH